MRHAGIVVLLLSSATGATAQDQATSGRGHFGAPVVKVTTLRNQTAVMFGGRGGWNVTPSLVLGFGGYATSNEVDAPASVPLAPGPLDVRLQTFGFDLEYASHPAAPTYLTLDAFFGGAAVQYAKDKTTEQHGETDFMLLLEPAVGVERRVSRQVHLNLAASYRVVSGVEQWGLGSGDVMGASVAFAVKIGRF